MRNSAPACGARALMPNCCARVSTLRNASWAMPAPRSATSSTPNYFGRQRPPRRSSRSVFERAARGRSAPRCSRIAPTTRRDRALRRARIARHDQLKLARSLVEADVRDDRYLEGHVAQALLRENLAEACFDAGRRRGSLGAAEPRLDANRKTKRAGTCDLHLKSRHAVDEDLIDGVRADEVFSAGAVREHRHLLGTPHQILDDDPRRAGSASVMQNAAHSIANQRHREVEKIGYDRMIFVKL